MTQIHTCIQSTDFQLRLRLANLVPDLIEITEDFEFRWLQGEYYGLRLRATEWDHVLRVVRHRNIECGIELN